MKDCFIRGLLPRTQEDITMRDPTTFSEAVQMAVWFDGLFRPWHCQPDYGEPYSPADSHATPMELGATMQSTEQAEISPSRATTSGSN